MVDHRPFATPRVPGPGHPEVGTWVKLKMANPYWHGLTGVIVQIMDKPEGKEYHVVIRNTGTRVRIADINDMVRIETQEVEVPW